MNRAILCGMSLITLLPLACASKSMDGSDGQDSINDDPEVLEVGDLQIRYSGASTSHSWSYDKNAGKSLPIDDRISWAVDFQVTNKGNRPYTFTGWSYGKNPPTARDESSKEYEALVFKSGAVIRTANGNQIHEKLVLAPNASCWISVPFNRPNDNAKTMTIELPAEAFSTTGTFRVKVNVTNESRRARPMAAYSGTPAAK